MSELARIRPGSPVGIAVYVATGVLLLIELGIVWLMLHPNVPPDYHAYYIDQTTTCLNQPVSGAYEAGAVVSFLPDDVAVAKPLRVCGWEGPAGDGLHAVGTSARLRFSTTFPLGDAQLLADLSAVTRDGEAQPQQVIVRIDGEQVATWDVVAPTGTRFVAPVSATALSDGNVEVAFDFPDAVQMGRTDPMTRWRSIKLVSAGIVPASD